MAIPPALRRARKEQEAALIAQGLNPDGSPKTSVVDPAQSTPLTAVDPLQNKSTVVDPNSFGQGVEEKPTDTTTLPLEDQPPLEDAAQAAAKTAQDIARVTDNLSNNPNITPSEAEALRKELATLKDQYASQSGRLSAEAKRAAALQAQLESQNIQTETLRLQYEAAQAELQQQLNEYKAAQAKSQFDQQLGELNAAPDIGANDLEVWDKDQVNLIKGLTKSTVGPILKSLLTKVGELEAQVASLSGIAPKLKQVDELQASMSKASQAQAELTFYTENLTPLVPTWREIIKSDGWRTYLGTAVSSTGSQTHADLLNSARAVRDLNSISALFNKFLAQSGQTPSLGAVATPAKNTSTPTQTPKVTKLKTSDYEARSLDARRKGLLNTKEWADYKAAFMKQVQLGNVEDDAKIF